LLLAIVFLFVLGFAFFLVWWAHEASRDRSAMVGLYLMLGAPGFLLFIAGLAVTTQRGFGGLGPTLLCTGAGLLIPTVHPLRVYLARVGDFDPRDPVHILGIGIFLGALGFLGAQLIESPDPADVQSFGLGAIAIQGLFFAALAVIAVGYKIDRTWPQVRDRLGLVRPTAAGIWAACGVVVLGFMVGGLASWLTTKTNDAYARDIDKSIDIITTNGPVWLAAPVIGLSAGIGEELLFRGAIQPRYGIVPAALLFALLHSQYGFSFVTLGTFILGCLLGYVARKYGTTHSIIAHSAYNILAVILSSLAS
jgi:hypothetical protein